MKSRQFFDNPAIGRGRYGRRFSRQAGFTIIELFIAVGVGALLLGTAVPSFIDLVRDSRIGTAQTQLLSDLHAAKAEAIKRNAAVRVCARDTATDTCDAVTDWTDGWLVCTDADRNGACDAGTAADPNPLIVREPLDATLTLTGPAAGLEFTSTGTATAAGNYVLGGTWEGAPTRSAQVALTGYIKGY